MFAQDEVADLDRIMFLARGCYAGSRLTNMQTPTELAVICLLKSMGSIQSAEAALCACRLEGKDPKIVDLIAGKRLFQRLHKRLAYRELDTGSFYKPELSYDGKTIYFLGAIRKNIGGSGRLKQRGASSKRRLTETRLNN